MHGGKGGGRLGKSKDHLATEQVQGQDDQFSNALKKKKNPVKWLRIYCCGRILVFKVVLVTYCYETIPDRAIYGNKDLFWLTLWRFPLRNENHSIKDVTKFVTLHLSEKAQSIWSISALLFLFSLFIENRFLYYIFRLWFPLPQFLLDPPHFSTPNFSLSLECNQPS